MRDELLESLPSGYDSEALIGASRAAYVIHQTVAYEYSKPVSDLRQRLVILPHERHGDQQRLVHRFNVRAQGEARIRTRADRFGNTIVNASVPAVEHTIEFQTRALVIRAPMDGFAPWISAAPTQTRLTTADEAIRQAARSLGTGRDTLEIADAICELIHSSFTYAHDVTSVHTTAAQAWQLRKGVCQDMAHVMIAMCASLGICARYVSGHLVGDGASHAWIEVLDPVRKLVVAIDPTHRRRTDLRYITTAIGRDYRDVAPTSGTYTGHGSRGTLRISKVIRLAELG